VSVENFCRPSSTDMVPTCLRVTRAGSNVVPMAGPVDS
jgi:hypothetical protein